EGVGTATFLARAAALGLRPDQYSFVFHAETMEPRLTAPPFARALDELRALQSAGPEDAATLDAEGARAAFREGRVALLVRPAGPIPSNRSRPAGPGCRARRGSMPPTATPGSRSRRRTGRATCPSEAAGWSASRRPARGRPARRRSTSSST